MVVSTSIPQGTILSGKYRVVRELGRGGMAAVYEATNVDIGKRVAIKLLAVHLAASHTVVERFLREARAVSQIRSPHICDVYDAGRLEDGTPFLVLELLEGESLYDTMVRERQMAPTLTLAVILQVCRGLAKAHESGIVHRDLKPENIFLSIDEDTQLVVKILDFGLAKFYDPVETKGEGKGARLTREGAVFGTPAYMSPEQVRGQAAADTRADLWALACISYECFTGTTVWSTEDGVAMTFAQIATAPLPDPREYRPDLPESFTAWFRKALDRDIAQRFQTVQELADGLALAFGYQARGGGLDAALVAELSRRAVRDDENAITSRRARFAEMTVPARGGAPAPAPAAGAAARASGAATASGSGRTAAVALGARGSGSGPQPRLSPVASPEPVLVDTDDELPATRIPRVGRGAKVALGAGAAALVGALVALSSGEPPTAVAEMRRFSDVAGKLAATSPELPSGFRFETKHPWLPRVREAQTHVSKGEHDRALALLGKIFEQSKHGMVKNLLEQVQVAQAAKGGGCQILGYARPRRYDLLGDEEWRPVDAGEPTIARGLSAALMLWTDDRDGQRRAYAVPLDEALRNLALPLNVTPEGARVRVPAIVPAADRFLAVYWDAAGGSPGVFLRWLGADGIVAGPPVPVTVDAKPGSFDAYAVRASDGSFVVGWSELAELDSADLFMRVFDPQLRPRGPAVRLTDYVGRAGAPARVRDVELAVGEGMTHFAYGLAHGAQQQVRYLAVPTTSEPPGLGPRPPGGARERSLGDEILLDGRNEQVIDPAIGCTSGGCFVAWQALRGGATVAFVEGRSRKVQWHKTFAPRGRHPTVAVAPSGEARLVWAEGGRLVTAAVGREGIGPATRIARIVGDQPPASLSAGAKRGEWFLGWLDFEAGHLEPYAARFVCD
jgi:serine/threonine-protein kinase